MQTRNKTPGLNFNGRVWIIDKKIPGIGRVYERTGFGKSERHRAEIRLAELISEKHEGRRRLAEQVTLFREAATRFLTEETKRSIARDARCLELVDPAIGGLPLEQVHMGTLHSYIFGRREEGVRSSTVRRELAVVRRVLTLAARRYRHEDGSPWLKTAPPLLVMPDWEDSAAPYPLSWDEQERFFDKLPHHLRDMALFAVNTGLREQGVCFLRWDWEVRVPEMDTSIFITPGRAMEYADGLWQGEKNKEDQVVVLNRVAKSVVESLRGQHPEYVFTYRGRRVQRMHNSGWKKAWKDAGLPTDTRHTRGPHNLKHTFGRRLRAAGVPLETRKVLLHHTDGDITAHYSPAELEELITAAEKVASQGRQVTVLRRVV